MNYVEHVRLALVQLRAALAHHQAERTRWSARLDELENSLPSAERRALVQRARGQALLNEGVDALYRCADRDMSTAARHWHALHREIGHLEAVLSALDAAPPFVQQDESPNL